MQDHEDYMRRHDEPEEDDEQAAELHDPLEVLWAQHPAPWVMSDSRHAGLVSVFDATGRSILCTGDMEGCTMADIQLAHVVAAIPKLLELAREIEKEYPDAADWKDARQHLWSIATGALDIAHAA